MTVILGYDNDNNMIYVGQSNVKSVIDKETKDDENTKSQHLSTNEKDALDYIEGQLSCGYIDISSTFDKTEIDIIKKAISLYKENMDDENKDMTKEREHIELLEELKVLRKTRISEANIAGTYKEEGLKEGYEQGTKNFAEKLKGKIECRQKLSMGEDMVCYETIFADIDETLKEWGKIYEV